MSAIDKQQFYNGQKVYKDDVNGLLDYTVKNLENLVITHLGYGVVTGFSLTNEGGFALGVGAGLAYANDGKRLILEAGKQVDLTSLAPSVGTKTVLVGMLQDFVPSEPTTDNEGNLVYTKFTETVKFVSGVSLASEVLPLARVELSSSGILIITSIATTMEVPKAIGERTKGLVARNKSMIFIREDGFEHDLIRGIWRKPTFDATKTEGYSKGDIIWLLPPDYGTLWTPPPTEVTYPWVMTADHPYNLLGKEKTYQAQTQFTLKAIRLMSTKDNNTDNPLTNKNCIGSSWVVDEPYSVCEEGNSTVNGVLVNTTLYAGSLMEHYAKQLTLTQTGTGASDSTFTYPIPFTSLLNVEAWRGYNASGINDFNRVTVFPSNLTQSLTSVIVYSVSTVGGSNNYMTRVSARASGTWY